MVSSDLSRQGHHLSGSVSRTTYQQLLKIALEIGRWAEVIKFGYQDLRTVAADLCATGQYGLT